MRIVATAAAVLIVACATGAAAQDRPAAYANAEACLEANVDAAVAASTGATDAAEFLLGYLCADPVAAATKYEVNSELLASGKGLFEGFLTLMPAQSTEVIEIPDFEAMSDEQIDAWLREQEAAAAEQAEAAPAFSLDPAESAAQAPTDPFEGIFIDPVTGEIVTGDNPLGPMIVMLTNYLDATARSMSGAPPVFLREHTARLIVQRRR
ncbi:hypothetical protein [Brevundimonas sp.]|jgi:hypothetical protein|uniref:hypothetical protein n=1 Tax=Brevundimonas sp. TaxID=1871086 RepID=UPI002E0FB0E1|nr:hypothetical protein [Brevundimonas sp.]